MLSCPNARADASNPCTDRSDFQAYQRAPPNHCVPDSASYAASDSANAQAD